MEEEQVSAVKKSESSLDEWYESVRDIPLRELDDGDLSRACRQQLFLDSIIPVALDRLRLRPLAGNIYDGELFVSLKDIPSVYWEQNRKKADLLRDIAGKVAKQSDDEDLLKDAEEVKSRLH